MSNTITTGAPAQVSTRGIDLVASFEGFRADAYQDQVGVWTVGFGETWLGARRVQKGDHLNRAEALDRLHDRLNRDFAPGVAKACGAGLGKLTQAQFDACCSLAYNIGSAGFAGSTVARKIAAGDLAGAADAFRLWNKAGGRVLSGLVARRGAERQVFLKGYGS
jgi:lysozyme